MKKTCVQVPPIPLLRRREKAPERALTLIMMRGEQYVGRVGPAAATADTLGWAPLSVGLRDQQVRANSDVIDQEGRSQPQVWGWVVCFWVELECFVTFQKIFMGFNISKIFRPRTIAHLARGLDLPLSSMNPRSCCPMRYDIKCAF